MVARSDDELSLESLDADVAGAVVDGGRKSGSRELVATFAASTRLTFLACFVLHRACCHMAAACGQCGVNAARGSCMGDVCCAGRGGRLVESHA